MDLTPQAASGSVALKSLLDGHFWRAMGTNRRSEDIPEVTEIGRDALFSAIVEELLRHFADADVSGIKLPRWEAESIAFDVLDRFPCRERPKDRERN